MPTGIPFVKGHAYGNDFLLAPESEVEGRDLPALARAMCSRHEGIGADGLMIYAFGPSADTHAPVQRRRQPVRSVGQRHPLPGCACRARAPWHVPCCDRHASRRKSPRTAGPGRRRADVSRVDGDAAGHPPDRIPGSRRERAGRRAVGWKSSMRAARRSAARVAASHARARHRTPSEISRPHERLVRESRSAQSRAHPDLGARRRADASVGHRRMRRSSGRGRRTAARRATSK